MNTIVFIINRIKFEWDEAKNTINIEKHGYNFHDAPELFEGDRLESLDDRKDYGEPRHIILGRIHDRMVVAVYTRRLETVRIISLRKANTREKERFENKIKK